MPKNVYSLVLLDSVVDAVDRLAGEQSTSRSGLINQILAEYLSCPTPERRNRDIFSCMEKLLNGLDSFLFQEQPSGSMVTIRSVLHYRYRPTARYVLELYREPGTYLGELRVSFRTQNRSLLELSEEFFQFWEALESGSISPLFPEGAVPASSGPGRYTRRMLCPDDESCPACEDVAQAVMDYIRSFDSAMRKYFDGEGGANPEPEIEADYQKQLKHRVPL